MSRPLRIGYPGALYHLTLRGNARGEIFLDDTDRTIFLDVLDSVVERFGWQIYAYCLMGNHYHLLAETPEPNLSRGMRWLNGVYTQRFNRRHERVGHVFQGRFKAILVERDSYLLELARYIVLNPVRAGLTSAPEGWRWSSYRATAGEQSAPRWLSVNWILDQFGISEMAAQERYRQFVAAGLDRASPWRNLRGQVLLGTEPFVQALAPKFAAVQDMMEAPRSQRLAQRPALARLLAGADGAGRAQRDAAIREAHIHHAYTLAEIARHVGLHYATVSRIANRTVHQGKTCPPPTRFGLRTRRLSNSFRPSPDRWAAAKRACWHGRMRCARPRRCLRSSRSCIRQTRSCALQFARLPRISSVGSTRTYGRMPSTTV